MSKTPSIFISYNPKSQDEETLAVRLQTIGSVNGFNTLLPDRYANKGTVDRETKSRIKSADYFVIFASSNLSRTVLDEIKIAHDHLQDPSKVLVIYDKKIVTVNEDLKSGVTAIPFNPRTQSVDKIIKKILSEIHKKERTQKSKVNNNNGLLALLGIGLGLLVLAALVGSDDD